MIWSLVIGHWLHYEWTHEEITGLVNSFKLPSIDCQIALAEVYENVKFPSADESN